MIHIAPHPLFDINGHNLEIVLPLAPWEAALGAKSHRTDVKREHSADNSSG